MDETVDIMLWPDGTWADSDDFDWERDYSWKSDDYKQVTLTEDEYHQLCAGTMASAVLEAKLTSH